MKLSRRLQLILEQIPTGSRLADIGSDHALLPVAAAQQGVIVSAVAGEVNPGPYEAALKQVKESGMTEVIHVRKGDGLDVIAPGEADVITIAGMGGSLISAILGRGEDKLGSVRRLVLQPNVGEDTLRAWLLERGWVLIQELILEEDGKIYEILVAEPESAAAISNDEVYEERMLPGGSMLTREWLLRFGPWLTMKPEPVFYDKWRLELDKMARILDSLSRSELPAAAVKAEDMKAEMNVIQEVLACLPKDKL